MWYIWRSHFSDLLILTLFKNVLWILWLCSCFSLQQDNIPTQTMDTNQGQETILLLQKWIIKVLMNKGIQKKEKYIFCHVMQKWSLFYLYFLIRSAQSKLFNFTMHFNATCLCFRLQIILKLFISCLTSLYNIIY